MLLSTLFICMVVSCLSALLAKLTPPNAPKPWEKKTGFFCCRCSCLSFFVWGGGGSVLLCWHSNKTPTPKEQQKNTIKQNKQMTKQQCFRPHITLNLPKPQKHKQKNINHKNKIKHKQQKQKQTKNTNQGHFLFYQKQDNLPPPPPQKKSKNLSFDNNNPKPKGRFQKPMFLVPQKCMLRFIVLGGGGNFGKSKKRSLGKKSSFCSL